MGRLVWFGVLALPPLGAFGAVGALVVVGAAAGFAFANHRNKKLKPQS